MHKKFIKSYKLPTIKVLNGIILSFWILYSYHLFNQLPTVTEARINSIVQEVNSSVTPIDLYLELDIPNSNVELKLDINKYDLELQRRIFNLVERINNLSDSFVSSSKDISAKITLIYKDYKPVKVGIAPETRYERTKFHNLQIIAQRISKDL